MTVGKTSDRTGKSNSLLETLEATLAALDVSVSYESIGAKVLAGGLCRVKGAYRVIIDRRTAPPERVEILASALSRFDTSAIELDPAVAALIETHAPRRAPLAS